MSEQVDPNKYHVLNNQKKLIIVSLLVVFLVGLVPALGLVYYKFAVNRPAQIDRDVTFEVKTGSSLDDISTALYENNLINSKFLFYLYLKINNLDKTLQAGVFEIPAGTSIAELAQVLQHGINDVKITFLEGWRVEEFAREASLKLDKVDYESFVDQAKQYEGYLFPDTYYFNVDSTESDVLDRLRDTFDKKTKNLPTDLVASLGISGFDVIKLASIVEREVIKDEDKKLVAGILLKRLKDGELLGADATTQYAVAVYHICKPDIDMSCLGGAGGCLLPDAAEVMKCVSNDGLTSVEALPTLNWWPETLTQSDLDFQSPYNTRKVVGLPPTPISNPGLSSIDAVLHSQESDYYYYLTDNDGVTRYAKTLEEHNQNVAKYLSN